MTDQPARGPKAFWAELRRRRVVGTTIAYVVVGYLLIEAASVIFPLLLLPEWTVRAFMIMVMMGLPISIVLAWYFDVARPGDQAKPAARNIKPADEEQPTVPPSASAAFASVAVLPFENLSPDEGNQYLAGGISTELHSTLAKIHQLRVAARTSTLVFSGENIDVKEIARKLNVQFVISGSLRCVDDHLRITVELDNAVEGVQRARSYVVQFTPDALSSAVPLLKRAIQLDGDYTVAHAALASALAEQVLNGLSEKPARDEETALAAVDRAYRQTPGDPFVLKMCAAVWAYFGRTDRSLGALRAAVEISVPGVTWAGRSRVPETSKYLPIYTT